MSDPFLSGQIEIKCNFLGFLLLLLLVLLLFFSFPVSFSLV